MNKTDALSADLLGELTAATEDVSAVRQAEPIIRLVIRSRYGLMSPASFQYAGFLILLHLSIWEAQSHLCKVRQESIPVKGKRIRFT